MKKLFSVLMALCLFCAAAAALAETVPALSDMPLPVIEDGNGWAGGDGGNRPIGPQGTVGRFALSPTARLSDSSLGLPSG